jgi:hypothetical protein
MKEYKLKYGLGNRVFYIEEDNKEISIKSFIVGRISITDDGVFCYDKIRGIGKPEKELLTAKEIIMYLQQFVD